MDREAKIQELGIKAKVLMELNLEKPKEFNAERILNELMNEYEKLQLDNE